MLSLLGKMSAIRMASRVQIVWVTLAIFKFNIAVCGQSPGDVIPTSGPLTEVAALVEAAIEKGDLPGAVVGVWHRDQWLLKQAIGDKQLEPKIEPMTTDTVFDLASLTKPIATATSIWWLVQEGKIDPDQTACTYLPDFRGSEKEQITVRQLLNHTAGLIPDNALKDYKDGAAKSWERINQLSLRSKPGEQFAYSDVGFLVLGQIVEKVSGQTLDQFASDHIFRPLEMMETTYCPGDELQTRAAPTEKQNDQWIKGTVHDPRAAALGGVAGHAGLFSTVDDMKTYAMMLIEALQPPTDSVEKTVLSGATVGRMIEPQKNDRGTRTSGWDHQSPYSSNRGDGMSDQAFGHGGFTGTAMWIDPAKELVVIFLSNRLHPDGKGSVNTLAGKIGGLAVKAAEPRP